MAFKLGLGGLMGVVCAVGVMAPAAGADTLVTNGSPTTTFSQNKQNEPAVAIDPANHDVVVAGSNDEIDFAPCGFDTATAADPCPFTPGVGVSGVYFSFDGGHTFSQPTYRGFGARDGSPDPNSPIGTLPNYNEQGLVSDGDPTIAFGPRPDAHGHFSWSNGARLYYGNLTSNFSTQRSDQAFKGFEAIAVSHADDLQAAAAGSNDAWSAPRIVTQAKQSARTFSDKNAIFADDAASSPFFGNLYVCYTQFRGTASIAEPIAFSRSTDGGQTFSSPQTLSSAADNGSHGRQGCAVRTDSHGTVYVFFEGTFRKHSEQMEVRSVDGGVHFGRPQPVAPVVDVGGPDPTQGSAFDGVAGARTDSFPSVDVANGAPSGQGAPNTIALGWSDARNGLNHEESLVTLSDDGGASFGPTYSLAQAGDRPDFTALALSPDGRDLYLDYDGFATPFQSDTAAPREFAGVLRHADVSGTTVSDATTLSRGADGDARSSAANSLTDEFLGDYNYVAATDEGAVGVYNDSRNGADCPAVDAFRQALVDGQDPGNPPNPLVSCPATFGNSDIFAATVSRP